jgi:hypothetical protein
MSLYKTFSDDNINDNPIVNPNINNKTTGNSINGNPIGTPDTITATNRINSVITKLIKFENIIDNGIISLGKYTFLIKFALPIMEVVLPITPAAKKFHGSNPHNKNTVKLGVACLIISLNANVYTNSINIGFKKDHKNPRTEFLYFNFNSFDVKLKSNCLELYISLIYPITSFILLITKSPSIVIFKSN